MFSRFPLVFIVGLLLTPSHGKDWGIEYGRVARALHRGFSEEKKVVREMIEKTIISLNTHLHDGINKILNNMTHLAKHSNLLETNLIAIQSTIGDQIGSTLTDVLDIIEKLSADTAENWAKENSHLGQISSLMKRVENEETKQSETLQSMVKQISTLLDIQKSTCPNEWIQSGNSCFLAVKRSASWSDAFAICKNMGARLAEPDGVKAFTTLGNTIIFGHTFWLGASDRAQEGIWTWLESGRKLRKGDDRWLSGQPDNHRGNEDCLEVRYDGRTKFNDNHCWERYYFICEITLN